MTKTETEDQGEKERKEKRKEKKAEKQKRHRRNKKRRYHCKKWQAETDQHGKKHFFVNGKKLQIGDRRRKRRREYRAFVSSLVSGMRKKEENIWLRKLWNLERKVVIRNPIIKRKVQIATNKEKNSKIKK